MIQRCRIKFKTGRSRPQQTAGVVRVWIQVGNRQMNQAKMSRQRLEKLEISSVESNKLTARERMERSQSKYLGAAERIGNR